MPHGRESSRALSGGEAAFSKARSSPEFAGKFSIEAAEKVDHFERDYSVFSRPLD